MGLSLHVFAFFLVILPFKFSNIIHYESGRARVWDTDRNCPCSSYSRPEAVELPKLRIEITADLKDSILSSLLGFKRKEALWEF